MRGIGKLCAGIAVAAVAWSASPADAQDRPFNWTGFYVGVQGGVGWSDVQYDLIQNERTFDHSGNGGLIGGYVGYNYQVGSLLVLGIEAEGSFADIGRGSADCTIAQTATCSSNVNSLGSVRGRIGFLPADRLMIYGTAGWAFAGAEVDRVFEPNGAPFTSGVDETRSGWTVGFGAEVALTSNWIARLQFDHYDFDSETYAVPALSNVSDTKVDLDLNTVRIGLSYKFGGRQEYYEPLK